MKNIDPLGLKIIFEGDNETQRILREAYDEVNNTKIGHSMINKMLAAEREYIITGARPSDGNTCYDPTMFTIYIDVKHDLTACVNQAKGKACTYEKTPVSVLLAHEMGHVMGAKDDGKRMMNNVRAYENPFRKELGLPTRMKY